MFYVQGTCSHCILMTPRENRGDCQLWSDPGSICHLAGHCVLPSSPILIPCASVGDSTPVQRWDIWLRPGQSEHFPGHSSCFRDGHMTQGEPVMLGNKIWLFPQGWEVEGIDQEFLPPACDHDRRASLRALGRWYLPKGELRAEPEGRNQGLVTCLLVFAGTSLSYLYVTCNSKCLSW